MDNKNGRSNSVEDKKILLGKYEILKEIGRGGMGRVYKAYDPGLKREVALKILISEENESDVQRFLREAKALAQLHHPNIVTVYEIGNDGGQNYFTMDFIEGRSLQQILQKSTLSVRQTVTWMQKITQAIQYAHQQGVIHRDLKPANILIDKDNEPKILDFGLAKLSSESQKLSKSGMIIGTLQYMSPEQAEGNTREIDERSDVYSLGAILYEILAGRPPFTGNSFSKIVEQVLYKQPLPPTQIKRHVPEELESICLKALEKKRENRYQNAGELLEDLVRFAEKKSVKAGAGRSIKNMWNTIKRWKYFWILLFAVLAAILFFENFSKHPKPQSLAYFIPQIVEGDGQQTSIILINTFQRHVQGKIDFFGMDGLPVPFTLNGKSTASMDFSLNPTMGLKLQTATEPDSSIKVGYARIMPSQEMHILSIFHSFDREKKQITFNGVPSCTIMKCFRFLAVKNDLVTTATAFINTTDQTAVLQCKLIDITGKILSENKVGIPGRGFSSAFLDELFPKIKNVIPALDGTIHVSSNVPLAPVAAIFQSKPLLHMSVLPIVEIAEETEKR